jgi:hypothetical protein
MERGEQLSQRGLLDLADALGAEPELAGQLAERSPLRPVLAQLSARGRPMSRCGRRDSNPQERKPTGT